MSSGPSTAYQRLAKNRMALFGLRCIGALVALAIFAPVVAMNQPFVYETPEGWGSPWLRSLFNRLIFENSIDILFNLILVLSPVLVAGTWLWARMCPRLSRSKIFFRTAFAVFAVFALVSVKSLAGVSNPLHFTEKVVNHRALVESASSPSRSIFPPLPFSYRETNPSESLQSPNSRHWLGTDTEGRDVFARMLYGTRISLTIGVVAVLLYVSIGVVLGALAGYFGGWVDTVVSRMIEVMITFPSFFLILTLAALIEERSIFHVMIIIGLTSWTGVARLIRAEFLRQKNLEYVHAAAATGLKASRIMFQHILPNAIAPALVSATFGVASAILIESSLSFLGVGDMSVASWGETLNTGRVEKKLWLVMAPGAAIFFVVTIFNLVGEGVRDALDPKLKS